MRHSLTRGFRFGRLLIPLLALLAFAPLPAGDARASTSETDLQQIKRIQRNLLMQKARQHFAEAGGTALDPGRPAGAGDRAIRWREAYRTRPGARAGRTAAPERSAVIPIPDVQVNDSSGEPGNSSQNEPSMAAWGTQVVAAWNDWPNLSFTGSLQGYAYSNDGGMTFVDGGELPAPAGALWFSDPVVTVNQNTGEFFYCGLLEKTEGSVDMNGVGVIRGVFSGGALVWDTPNIARLEPDALHFLDKPWMVADTVSGYLYLTYSDFVPNSNSIVFQRSGDGGLSWGPVITLSSPSGAGLVQGSRPAVGPNGEVYTVWKEIGTAEADFLRMRVSLTQGATFGPERTVTALFDNFGTGAPGFNRERGIAFPSIAVDRTDGPERGRIYVAWNESFNWLDDAPGVGTTRSETEDNQTFAHADPFTPGETLSGSFQSTSDLDTYVFNAVQGSSYIFWCDSAPSSLYQMLIFCTDTLTKLAFTGHLNPPFDAASNQRIMMWTAPSTGSYYLCMDFVNAGSSIPAAYRIRTGIGTRGEEPGRDQRDVFVTSSSNGGDTWGTPVRINDDPPYFDNWLPEVAVGGDESVYTIWYDWRDTPAENCGGMSHVYMARSDDHGASWVQLGRISTALSDWSFVSSNLIPNEGDYLSLFADENAAYACWTDGRFGSPDIFAVPVPLIPDTLRVSGTAAVEPGRITVTWQFQVGRVVNATVYRSDGGAPATLATVTSDATGKITFPDENISNGVLYTYSLGVLMEGSEIILGAVSVSAPAGKFHARPNPIAGTTRLLYDVAAAGEQVKLAVYDVTGRKIRELVHGFQAGGTHSVPWDTRDGDGHDLSSGIYFIHLVRGGRESTIRVAVVR